ncbi:RNA ligase [Pacmanvirus A23]|uniref:RNA ligase n=1 Tax=Pacmanvirus A23 TaxID=1932881 RepID=UPI000A0961DD|nr:RNA ligase [Pacmanvirus A23]SIP85939.1 RNA ligase [Pacmanvirus A23]
MEYPSIESFTYGANFSAAFKDESENASRNHLWYIQEKIDGSNMRFRIDPETNELVFFCRRRQIDTANEIFSKTCKMINILKNRISPTYVYHGEAVSKCKHNVSEYLRIPRHYFICFDIYDIEADKYLTPNELKLECERVGFESIKFIYSNLDKDIQPTDMMNKIIKKIETGEIESMLGGIPEGIVLKHESFWYKNKYTAVKRKLVTKKFKERHQLKQNKKIVSADEFLKQLGSCFATDARFAKAKQHLSEQGILDGTPADKRRILKELDEDFIKEYGEEIKIYLYQELIHHVLNASKLGADEWIDKNL